MHVPTGKKAGRAVKTALKALGARGKLARRAARIAKRIGKKEAKKTWGARRKGGKKLSVWGKKRSWDKKSWGGRRKARAEKKALKAWKRIGIKAPTIGKLLKVISDMGMHYSVQ